MSSVSDCCMNEWLIKNYLHKKLLQKMGHNCHTHTKYSEKTHHIKKCVIWKSDIYVTKIRNQHA